MHRRGDRERPHQNDETFSEDSGGATWSTSALSSRTFKLCEEAQSKGKKLPASQPTPNPPETNFPAAYGTPRAAPMPPFGRGTTPMCMWYPNAWGYPDYFSHMCSPYHSQASCLSARTYSPHMYHPPHESSRSTSQSPPPRGVPQESFLGAIPSNGPLTLHPPHPHQPTPFLRRPHIHSSSRHSTPHPNPIPNPQVVIGYSQTPHLLNKHQFQPPHRDPHMPLNPYYPYPPPPPNMDPTFSHAMAQFQSPMYASAHRAFAVYPQYIYRPMAAHVSRAHTRSTPAKRESVGTSKTPTRSESARANRGAAPLGPSASPQEMKKRARKEVEHARGDFSSTAPKSVLQLPEIAPALQTEEPSVQTSRSYCVLPQAVPQRAPQRHPEPPTVRHTPSRRPPPSPTPPPPTNTYCPLRRRAESFPRAGYSYARKLHTDDTPLPPPTDADYSKMWEQEDRAGGGYIRRREITPKKRRSEPKLSDVLLGENLHRSARSSTPQQDARVLGYQPEKPFCQAQVPLCPGLMQQSSQKRSPRDLSYVPQASRASTSQMTMNYGRPLKPPSHQEVSSGGEILSTDTSSPYPSSLSEMPERLKPSKSAANEAEGCVSRGRSSQRRGGGCAQTKLQQQMSFVHPMGRVRSSSVVRHRTVPPAPPEAAATAPVTTADIHCQRRARQRCLPGEDSHFTAPREACDRVASASGARSGRCRAPSRRRRRRWPVEASPSPPHCTPFPPALGVAATAHPLAPLTPCTSWPTHPATAAFAVWPQYIPQSGHYSQMRPPYGVPSDPSFNVTSGVETTQHPKRPASQQMPSESQNSPIQRIVGTPLPLRRLSDTRLKLSQLLVSSLPTLEEVTSSTSKGTTSVQTPRTILPCKKSKTAVHKKEESRSKGDLPKARALSVPPSTPTTPTALSCASTPPTPPSREASSSMSTLATPSSVSARTLTHPSTPYRRTSRDPSVRSDNGQGDDTTSPSSQNSPKPKWDSLSACDKVLIPVKLPVVGPAPRKLHGMQRVTVKIVRDEEIVSSVTLPLKTVNKSNSGPLCDDKEESCQKKGPIEKKGCKKKGYRLEKKIFRLSSTAGDEIMNDVAALKGVSRTVRSTWETCYVVQETDGTFSSDTEASRRALAPRGNGPPGPSRTTTESNAGGEGSTVRPTRASRPHARAVPASSRGSFHNNDASNKSTSISKPSSKTEAHTKDGETEGTDEGKLSDDATNKDERNKDDRGGNCVEQKKQISGKIGVMVGRRKKCKRKESSRTDEDPQSLSTDTQFTEVSPQQNTWQTLSHSIDSKTSLKSKTPPSQAKRRRQKYRRRHHHRHRVLKCLCQMVPDSIYRRQKCWCRRRMYMNSAVGRWDPVGMCFLKIVNPAEEPTRRWSSPPARSPTSAAPRPHPATPPTPPPSTAKTSDNETNSARDEANKDRYAWTWVCPPCKFVKGSRRRQRIEETLPSCLKITGLSYKNDEYLSVEDPFFGNLHTKKNCKKKRPVLGRVKWRAM